MSTQFLRPTGRGDNKNASPWLLKGTWGQIEYPPMSRVNLYDELRKELILSGLLPPDTPLPSNQYHDHVTMLIMKCSLRDGRWVRD
jgi:hypothetical protein